MVRLDLFCHMVLVVDLFHQEEYRYYWVLVEQLSLPDIRVMADMCLVDTLVVLLVYKLDISPQLDFQNIKLD